MAQNKIMNKKIIFTVEKLNAINIDKNIKGYVRFYDAHPKGNGLILAVRASGRKTFMVRDRVNGKSVTVTLGNYPDMSIDQARRHIREVLNKLSDGINPNEQKKANRAKSVTLKECLNDYIRVNHRLAKSTISSYKVSAEQYLADWLNKPLLEITRDMVEKRHLTIGKKSPTRANYTSRLIRALFNFAHGEYENESGEPIFTHNPVARISHRKLWFSETRRKTYISDDDMPKWFNSVATATKWVECTQANTSSIKDYLLFMWLTGLRREECAKIKKEWISINNKSLTIPHTETKNGHEHSLPLSNYLMEIVIRRFNIDSPYLFTGKTSDNYIKEPKRIIKLVREHSEVHFTLHDLRRTFITNANYLGIDGYQLKRLINHRDKNDVTDEYIVTDIEHYRPIMQKITDRMLTLAHQKTAKHNNVVSLFG